MTVVVAPIFTRMNSDATLTAQLSTFNGNPAIFSNMPTPHGAEPPFIMISPPVADTDFDTLKEFDRDITHNIWIVFPNTGSVSGVDVAAERVRTLFHKVPSTISVTGYQVVQTWARGPFDGQIEGIRSGFQIDQIDEIARRVSVRILLRNL